MPIKYVGRTTDFKGKTLWEILGNLKKFGIGRIVCRSMFERYPEPCYYKILKVEPLPNPANQSIDDVRKVRVQVEKTFRGKTYPKPITIESAAYKADYKLIPKDEETNFCRKYEAKPKILAKYMNLPPLMNELILKEMKQKGEKVEGAIKIEVVYRKQVDSSKYKIANDGEKADVEINVGLGKPVSQSLYKDIL